METTTYYLGFRVYTAIIQKKNGNSYITPRTHIVILVIHSIRFDTVIMKKKMESTLYYLRFRVYTVIMEKKMETTIYYLGFRVYTVIMETKMETTIYYLGFGVYTAIIQKKNGNYYIFAEASSLRAFRSL